MIEEAFKWFPKNPVDFLGGYILYSKSRNEFYRVAWGTGDNLDSEDEAAGFDDYFMYETAAPAKGSATYDEMVVKILTLGGGEFLDDIRGLLVQDAGMLLVKHADLEYDGDLRSHLGMVLRHGGYKGEFDDLVFVSRFD